MTRSKLSLGALAALLAMGAGSTPAQEAAQVRHQAREQAVAVEQRVVRRAPRHNVGRAYFSGYAQAAAAPNRVSQAKRRKLRRRTGGKRSRW